MDDSSCKVSCKGLYADVDFVDYNVSENSKSRNLLKSLIKDYESYKKSRVKSFEIIHDYDRLLTVPKPYERLRVVQIYFDTATYDNIEKDVSVTLADQLGVIGGTMGLFAGFSFLSALEIIYYAVKYLISLVNRKINV